MDVILVKIYLTEAENRLKPLMHFLHEEAKVRGATVLRGIEGFGQDEKIHTSHFMSLSLNLPLVIEFFDSKARVDELMPQLQALVKPDHILCLNASLF